MHIAAVSSRTALSPEDQARADFYALLARLYSDAPDAALLAAIAEAPPLEVAPLANDEARSPGLAQAWDALRAASAAMNPGAAGRNTITCSSAWASARSTCTRRIG